MGNTTAVALACLIVLVLTLIAVQWCAGAPAGCRDGFYTEHGQEEPTRSHTPYTGTVPLGHWGTLPWAEEVPPPRGGVYRCEPPQSGLYGNLSDVFTTHAPRCLRCGGALFYHNSVQRADPHRFEPGPAEKLQPHEAGPHWEGGYPLLN